MKRMAMITGALLLAIAVTAAAETTTPPRKGTGGYATLSPSNQKIARALFKAQTSAATTTGAKTTTRIGTTTAPKALTLDEIAAMKTSGQGWEQIFHRMKSQGLVRDKSLGQAIARYNHSTKTAGSNWMVVTSARGQSTEVEKHRRHAHNVGRDDSSRGSESVSAGGGHR